MNLPPWEPPRLSWLCWGGAAFLVGVFILGCASGTVLDLVLAVGSLALLGWLEWKWPTFDSARTRRRPRK